MPPASAEPSQSPEIGSPAAAVGAGADEEAAGVVPPAFFNSRVPPAPPSSHLPTSLSPLSVAVTTPSLPPASNLIVTLPSAYDPSVIVAGPCGVSIVPESLPPVFFRFTVSGISPKASLLATPSYLPEMSAAAFSSKASLLNGAANAADEINSAIASSATLLRNCIFQSPN